MILIDSCGTVHCVSPLNNSTYLKPLHKLEMYMSVVCCQENLAGRNFTFWEWFWSVGKLVREHLKGPWTDE